MRGAFLAIAAAVGAALLLAAAGSPRGVREGGTFRVAVAFGSFNGIDPALPTSLAGMFSDARMRHTDGASRQAVP